MQWTGTLWPGGLLLSLLVAAPPALADHEDSASIGAAAGLASVFTGSLGLLLGVGNSLQRKPSQRVAIAAASLSMLGSAFGKVAIVATMISIQRAEGGGELIAVFGVIGAAIVAIGGSGFALSLTVAARARRPQTDDGWETILLVPNAVETDAGEIAPGAALRLVW